jgi:type I restriction enzyme S subunit
MELRLEFKQTEVGVIPNEWDVKTIGEIAETYSGGTPSTTIPEYYGGDINWITSSELNKGRIHEVDGRITQLGLDNSAAKMVGSETLLLALYGATAGVSAITYIEAAINQAVLAVKPKKACTEYLYQQLSSHNTVDSFKRR